MGIMYDYTDRHTDRHTDGQTHRDTHTDRQTQTDTDRHTHTQTDTLTCVSSPVTISVWVKIQSQYHKLTCKYMKIIYICDK